MGSGYLDVGPERMRQSGEGIRSAAHQLGAAWETFQSELSGYGEPWGQDMIGSLIGGCYHAVLQAATECIEEHLEGLGWHADGVNAMAAHYFQAEDASEVEINHVRDVLG